MHAAVEPVSAPPRRRRSARLLSSVAAMVITLLLLDVPVAMGAAKPSARLSPSSGPPGTEVTVTGDGWPPGHTIVASFPDRGFYVAGSSTSAADGSFTISFRWPDGASPGPHQVAVIDDTGPAETPPYPEFTVTPGQAPASTSTASVERAFTTDGSSTEKTTFTPGDPIWYVVTIRVDGAPVHGSVRWKVTGPRALYDYTNGGAEINPGYQAPYAPSTIPRDAPAGQYELTATVTINGETSVRTSTFTVQAVEPRPRHTHTPGEISKFVISVIGEENRESTAMCTFDVATDGGASTLKVGVEVLKATGGAVVIFTSARDGKTYKAVVTGGGILNDITGTIGHLSCAEAAAGLAPRLLNAYWDKVSQLLGDR